MKVRGEDLCATCNMIVLNHKTLQDYFFEQLIYLGELHHRFAGFETHITEEVAELMKL